MELSHSSTTHLKRLELLAPAKNLEQGKAAIDHGADAVYIGASSFGARVAAGNSIDDIRQLVEYAHLFHCQVFATVNTLLYDNELESAVQLVWQLYEAGVDALIVQDMGLLECDMPPIALHASTQTHNIDIRRIQFLERVGFRRVILARETSLEQMRSLRKATSLELETFVQGALCVSYSGQCYLSQYLAGRSGNRGCCSQPCRSSYDLCNAEGQCLRHDEHLLSLKDFSAAQHLDSMIDAGITSFKIEGRLKDLPYVKNLTAYYCQLLDHAIASRQDCCRSSSGSETFSFTPDPARTFNRGFTDYFLVQRQPMASTATQKSLGKRLGTVLRNYGKMLEIKTAETVYVGDGLCYFASDGQLEGFLVNGVEQPNGAGSKGVVRIKPNKVLAISEETEVWRNHDHAFEKLLQGNSAERKVAVSMTVGYGSGTLSLQLDDEDGCQASAEMDCVADAARDAAQATATLERQLTKLGGTPFTCKSFGNNILQPLFIPSATLNELRRRAVAALVAARLERFHPADCQRVDTFTESDNQLLEGLPRDYRANVVNHASESFYTQHGLSIAEHGLEETQQYGNKALMTCKYCIRYELGQCLKLKNNRSVSPDYRGDLFLVNNGKRFRLDFDCARCEMRLVLPATK